MKLSPITNSICQGPGAERELVMYDGSVMRQVLLDCEEDGSLLIGCTHTDLPISSATARFTVAPPDQPFCRVSVAMTFEPRHGLVGSLPGYLYRPAIRNRLALVLRGLRHFVSAAQPVGQQLP